MSTAYSGKTAIKATTAIATAWGISSWAASQVQVSTKEAPKMAMPHKIALTKGLKPPWKKDMATPGMQMAMEIIKGNILFIKISPSRKKTLFLWRPLCDKIKMVKQKSD